MPNAALESRPDSTENQGASHLATAGSWAKGEATNNVTSFSWANSTSLWGTALVWWRPANADPEQDWFWTASWQTLEAEADADIAAGRVIRFESEDEFSRAMDELLSDADL